MKNQKMIDEVHFWEGEKKSKVNLQLVNKK